MVNYQSFLTKITQPHIHRIYLQGKLQCMFRAIELCFFCQMRLLRILCNVIKQYEAEIKNNKSKIQA